MPVATRAAGPARRAAAAVPASPARQRAGKASPARSSRSSRSAASASTRRRASAAGARAQPTRAAVPVAAGIMWAVALIGVTALSSFLTALLLGGVAVVATASGMRSTDPRARSAQKGRPRQRSRSRSGRPSGVLVVALVAAVLDPLAALGGAAAAVGVLLPSCGAVAAMVLASGYAASARPLRAAGSRLVAALAPTVAATAVVVARHQGSNLALALVFSALAYDAGAFLMGNSRTASGGPVGVAFGVASVAVVAVFVAAVMDPPFGGSRPWVVFALMAVAAPLGVRLGRVVGERLPALRRVDSLLVMAPVWVVAVALLLHR